MKGANEIIFNQATMIAAVQHYFDTVLFASGKSPKVQSVKPQREGTYGATDDFRVLANSPEPVKEHE